MAILEGGIESTTFRVSSTVRGIRRVDECVLLLKKRREAEEPDSEEGKLEEECGGIEL